MTQIDNFNHQDTTSIDNIQQNILKIQSKIKEKEANLKYTQKKLTLELNQFQVQKKQNIVKFNQEILKIDQTILEYYQKIECLNQEQKNVDDRYLSEIKYFQSEIENLKSMKNENFIYRFQNRNQNFNNLIKFKDLEKKNLTDIQKQEQFNDKLKNERNILLENQEKEYQDILSQNNLELQNLKTNNSNLDMIDSQLNLHQKKLNILKNQQEKNLNQLDFKINQNLEKMKILQLEKNQIHDNHKNQNLTNHNYLEDIKIWKSKISKLQNQKKFELLQIETEIEDLDSKIVYLNEIKKNLTSQLLTSKNLTYQNKDLKQNEICIQENISEMKQEIIFYQKEMESNKLARLETLDNLKENLKNVEIEIKSKKKKLKIQNEEINFFKIQKNLNEKKIQMDYDSQKEYHNKLILKELSIMLNINST